MTLANVSWVAGLAVGLFHLPLLVAPSSATRLLERFPRSRFFAWTLTAVDLLWAAWLLDRIPLGRFDPVKDYLIILAPIAWFAIVFLVDELLAARALGGLLALVPSPLLDIARWHESDLRRVVVVLAYACALSGIALLLGPYWFRRTVRALAANDGACRIWGATGLFVGLLLVVLGLAVY